jgi:hypothetical protein
MKTVLDLTYFINKKAANIIVFAFFMLFFNSGFSQDIILKKNNEQIKAKILEVGSSEIKFKYYDAPDGPIITIKKEEIRSITIKGKEGQNTVDFTEDPMSVSNRAIVDKTSSLKFNFFSPLNNNLAFFYEWMYKPGFNFEAGLGIIGPGVGVDVNGENTKARGGFVRAGAKFLLGNTSDFEVEGSNLKYAHPLKGRYMKIEILFNAFKRTSTVDTSYSYYSSYPYTSAPQTVNLKNSYAGMALHLIYGRQYILGNAITAGWYGGIGYAFESKHSNYPDEWWNYSAQRYSHIFIGDVLPISFTWGMNIGFILKTPKKLLFDRTSDQNRYWIDKRGAKQKPRKF